MDRDFGKKYKTFSTYKYNFPTAIWNGFKEIDEDLFVNLEVSQTIPGRSMS